MYTSYIYIYMYTNHDPIKYFEGVVTPVRSVHRQLRYFRVVLTRHTTTTTTATGTTCHSRTRAVDRTLEPKPGYLLK